MTVSVVTLVRTVGSKKLPRWAARMSQIRHGR
jgi:hypothetical protein